MDDRRPALDIALEDYFSFDPQHALTARLVDALPIGLFLKDGRSFRYLAWNSAMTSMTGLSAEEVVGRTDFQIFSQGSAESYRATDLRVLETGERIDAPQNIVLAQDRHIAVRTIKTLLGSGASAKILGLCLDLTDLNRYRNELERHREMLRLSANLAGIGYWEYAVKEDRFRTDDHGRSLLKDILINTHPNLHDLSESIHPGDWEDLRRSYLRSVRERREFDCEFRAIDSTGRLMYFHIRAVHVFGDGNSLLRSLGSMQDISTRVLAQRRAEESDRLKSAFLANMSHEIRTPLNAILGFARFLARDDLSNQERRKYGEIVEQNGEHLLSLMTDMLDLARIESGLMEIQRAPVELTAMMRRIQETYVHRIRNTEGRIRLVLELPGDIPLLASGDEVRIKQVMGNLLDNALKFTEEGRVVFGARETPDQFELYVEDTGPGIPEDEREKVLGLFRQVDEGYNRRYGGAGLGLAICRHLVEMMGSSLELQSIEGKGSRFSFFIPRDRTQGWKH